MHPQPRPLEQSLDHCIKCNICTTACPVSAVTDLFPGPKYSAPQGARFRNPDQHPPDKSVDYCSGCRVCNMVCPHGVKIAEMNARARATVVEKGNITIRNRIRNNLLARTELIGKIGHPVAPLANFALDLKISRWLADKSLGIAKKAPFPSFTNQKFTTWFKSHPTPDFTHKKVVYFHGCSTEYYEPRIGRAAIHILEASGFEVIVPPQYCCGLPLLSNGEFSAARSYHANNVQGLSKYARLGIPIVGTSTSCTLTLKEEAPELLDMYDEETQLVANNTYDFNEFVLYLVEEGSFLGLNGNDASLRSIPLTLAYHAPCQYRAHRLGSPAVELLEIIPDLNLIESNAPCCGIAGTYGYKSEKYDISIQVGTELFEFIKDVDGPIAICDSETCRWQITHVTGTPVVHPVELLSYAVGGKCEGVLANLLKGNDIK